MQTPHECPEESTKPTSVKAGKSNPATLSILVLILAVLLAAVYIGQLGGETPLLVKFPVDPSDAEIAYHTDSGLVKLAVAAQDGDDADPADRRHPILPGQYIMTFSHEKYQPIEKMKIEVKRDGSLLDENGKPIEKIGLVAMVEDTPKPGDDGDAPGTADVTSTAGTEGTIDVDTPPGTGETGPLIPPAPEPIVVTITSEPAGATILIGGEPIDDPTDTELSLPPGTYAIDVELQGHVDQEPRTVELTEGQAPLALQWQFEPVPPATIAVTITTDPAEAAITVGEQTAAGSLTVEIVKGEGLTVTASHPDCEPMEPAFFTADRLADLGGQVRITLEPVKTLLPRSLNVVEDAGIDPATQLPRRVRATVLNGKAPMELVLVPPATFLYGVPEQPNIDMGEYLNFSELVGKQVLIDTPYYIGVHEVTNAQYKAFAATDPAAAGESWGLETPTGDDLPVTNVSIDQARAFAKWIGGRLPREQEWELAARGPDSLGYPYPWVAGEPDAVRCALDHGGERKPVPVTSLPAGATPTGLMHMLGNVQEWCDEPYQGGFDDIIATGEKGYLPVRGCGFNNPVGEDVRVTWRSAADEKGGKDIGLRVVVPVELP